MKIKRIDSPEPFRQYDFGPRDFENYEVAEIEKQFPTATDVVYWYSYGCYEGAGQLLIRTPEGWHHHDCGHCSCYGPTERLAPVEPMSLNQIADKCASMNNEMAALIEAALAIEVGA